MRMRTLLHGAAVALLLALHAPPAQAGQVEDDVRKALEAIKDGDFETAQQLLDQAEANVATTTSVVLGSSLASIWYYRGVLEYYNGDPNKKTLELWRMALLADLSFPFDTTLVADQEPRDLFEALRLEVSSRPHYDGGMDESQGAVKVFVDGQLLHPYSLIVGGRHLVQVACEDGVMRTAWYDFGSPPDYYAMCTEGGGLAQGGGTPGGEEGDGQTGGGEGEGDGRGEKPPKEPREPREPREGGGPGLGLVMLGTGGALMVGGAAVNFLVVNPAYAQIEDARERPATVTRAEADALTGRFNTSRVLTLGLLGAGAATFGVSFFLGEQQVVLTPTGSGVGLSGTF